MAGNFSTFIATLQDWANRSDWSLDLVTSFVRDAEAKFNAELRVRQMLQFDEALIINRCAPLPDDWLEMEFVRIQDSCAPDGFSPIRYRARDEFFRQQDDPRIRNYTIEGNQIYFSGPPDDINGITYKLVYFGEVPVFSDTVDSWIYDKYQSMYRNAAMISANLHAVGEEQNAANVKQLCEDAIGKLNAAYQYAKASGSRLARARVRSFG
jgi:hypothetical protein